MPFLVEEPMLFVYTKTFLKVKKFIMLTSNPCTLGQTSIVKFQSTILKF